MTRVMLSTLDQVFATDAFEPMTFALLYSAPLSRSQVEDAFDATCAAFPGASGILSKADEHQAYLECNVPSVKLEFAEEQGDFPLEECVPELTTGFGAPVLRVRMTRVGADRTAIGIAMSHCLADGFGFFLFLTAWALRSAGKPFPPCNVQRELLTRAGTSAASVAALIAPLASTGFHLSDDPDLPPRLQWQEEIVVRPPRGAEAEERPKSVSKSDLLCARLWKRSLEFTTSPQTTCTTYVDIRRHLPGGALYFGNGSLPTAVTVPTSELEKASEMQAAEWIRDSFARVPSTIDSTLFTLDSLRRTVGLDGMRRVRNAPATGTGFFFSNMSAVVLDTLDFGMGAPSAATVRSAAARSVGSLVMRSGHDLLVRTARP